MLRRLVSAITLNMEGMAYWSLISMIIISLLSGYLRLDSTLVPDNVKGIEVSIATQCVYITTIHDRMHRSDHGKSKWEKTLFQRLRPIVDFAGFAKPCMCPALKKKIGISSMLLREISNKPLVRTSKATITILHEWK